MRLPAYSTPMLKPSSVIRRRAARAASSVGPTGEGHDGLWSVELTHADGRVESFTDLTCAQEFRELSWLGFTSHATDTAATYIDNLVVRMAD